MRGLLFGLCVGLMAAPAAAQTINPTTVAFTASTDHDLLDSTGAPVLTHYELRLYLSGAAQPFATHDLGKPVPVATEITVVNPAWFVGIGNGTVCVARVAALGPAGEGLSAPSNTWTRNVAPPAKGVVGLDTW